MRVATYNLLKGGTKRVHWLKMIVEHEVDLFCLLYTSDAADE